MRAILFLLCIIAACGMLFAFCGAVAEMSPNVYFEDAVLAGGMPEYESSPQFAHDVGSNLQEMGRLSLQYGSEENLLTGSAADMDAESLNDFTARKAHLDESEGFHYFISGKAGTITNMKAKTAEAAFESCRQNPVYLICGENSYEHNIPNQYAGRTVTLRRVWKRPVRCTAFLMIRHIWTACRRRMNKAARERRNGFRSPSAVRLQRLFF